MTKTAPFSRICSIPTEVKAVTEDGGGVYVEGVASSGRVDRQGEVVNQASLHRAFSAHPKGLPYLWQHDHDEPVGKVIGYEMRGDRIATKARVINPDRNDRTRRLIDLLELEVPMSQSIGFNPTGGMWADWAKSGDEDDEGIWHWGGVDGSKDFDLLELSAVTIGANQDADLQVAKSLGIEYDRPWKASSIGLLTDIDKAEDKWPATAYAACAIAAGYKIAAHEIPAAVRSLRKHYETLGKAWPEGLGEMQFKEMTWPNDEQAVYEETRFLSDIQAAARSFEGAANMIAHWATEGRAPSATVIDTVLSTMSLPVQIIRAGRVLSDKNRDAVLAAVEALNDVITRDNESAARKPSDEGEDEKSMSALERAWYGAQST